MKKRLVPWLTACLLLTGCSGLPAAREMGDMALLRAMGVDAAPGGVAVTGSTGPRAKGIQSEEEPALTLSADRESLGGACLAMQGQSDSYVFFGYVDQLLVGEELAEQDVRPVLDYFARDQELGLGAQLWLVRGGTARNAVFSGGEEGIDQRLETLRTDSEMGITHLTRTAGELYTDLLEQSASFAPALSLSDGALTESGYGIFKDFSLVGFLDGEAARGLELLQGGPSTHILETGSPDNKVSLKVTSASTKSDLCFYEDSLSSLELTCKIEAHLSEYQRIPSPKELEYLRSGAEAREQARLEAALDQLRSWGADCTGLGAKAAMTRPAQWQKIQSNWPVWFSQLPIEIRVEIKLDR